MFRARFRKYWCDSTWGDEIVPASSVEEILEYVYKIHKDSVYPGISRFLCRGDRDNKGGYLEASCSLKEKWGYRGSIWLESITYQNSGNEVIIFSKNDRYISPKASVIFDEFAETAKYRDANKNFGDF